MKSFFKSLLASILGCTIVIGGLFLVSILMIIALTPDTTEKYTLKDDTVLRLNLSGVMSDRVEKNPFLELFGDKASTQLSLVDILQSIKVAKNNNKVKGIYIKAGALSASSASLKEIRDALLDFKESDKFIVSYGDIYTQGCYYLASISDKVILNPEGSLDIHGLSASPMFYKGLLDKVGVEMQIFKVGTFKSAVEPYITTQMSDANREQVSAYISDIWKTTVSEIGATRNISAEKINELADQLPAMQKSQDAVDNKLVDGLMYETEFNIYVKELVGKKEKDKLNMASASNLIAVSDEVSKAKDVVAILYAEGTISQGNSKDGITDGRYVKELDKLKNDDKVKAVVFRVNSPGGSAFASEQIWKAVADLKTKKPIVVSMGDLAASGGYYISCNATKIFAQPNTLTGSIGIFGMFPNMEGLTTKLGLSFDNVKTNKHADFGDLSRPMRDDEKAILQGYVERGYDLFLKRCAEGRGVTSDSINSIGQGRVWTGNQALSIGLVDELGGIDDALAEAVKLAELDKYSVQSYPKPADMLETFFMTQKEEFASRMMQDYLGTDFQVFKIMKEIKQQDPIQARLPYDFNVQ